MSTLEESYAAATNAPQKTLEDSYNNALANSEAVPDTQAIPESQFKPATAEDLPKQVPGFMKTAEMIGSGAMKGSLEFTGRLLSFAEKHTTGTSYVNDAYKHWSDKEEEDRAKYNGAGFLHGLGELPAEIVTTAPAGPLFGASAKMASAAGKAVPYGLQRATQYGVGAGTGGAVISGMEGLRSGENMGDSPFSAEQAAEALQNKGTYIAPAFGTFVGNWAEKANKLDEAKKLIPGITNRHLNTVKVGDEGVEKTTLGGKIKSLVFDSISNQTGFGHSARLQESIGDDVSNYINKLSGNVVAKYSKDYREIAGKEFQRTLKGMKQKENDLWNLPFKTQNISNPQEVSDLISQAQTIIQKTKMPNSPAANTFIKDIANKFKPSTETTSNSGVLDQFGKQIKQTIVKPQKGAYTVEDVKNMRSVLGDVAVDAADMGLVGSRIGKQLQGIREQLNSSIRNSISPEFQKDYTAASLYSAKYYELKNESKRIQEALFDDVDARAVIKSMVSEAEVINKAKTLGVMNKEAQEATTATKLAGALEAAGYPEKRAVDLERFVQLTGRNTVVPELMGETHKSFIGLTNLLKSIQESGSHKTSKYLLALGGVAAAGAVASGGALPVLGALASYAALASIANRSPLKTTFSYLSKKLSPSVYEALSKRAQDLMVRGGYFINDKGVLDVQPTKKKSGVQK